MQARDGGGDGLALGDRAIGEAMAADNTDSLLVVGFADPAPVIGELVSERDSACLERFGGGHFIGVETEKV